MFSGSIPALVTTFRDGAVDEAAFRALVDWQIEEGSSALVPCGTTGESATMTVEEHNRVIAICVDQAAGRVPVIAGCGSNDTRIALEHMYAAQAAGADAALVVTPYYNKPTQKGLIAHYKAIAEAVGRVDSHGGAPSEFAHTLVSSITGLDILTRTKESQMMTNYNARAENDGLENDAPSNGNESSRLNDGSRLPYDDGVSPAQNNITEGGSSFDNYDQQHGSPDTFEAFDFELE